MRALVEYVLPEVTVPKGLSRRFLAFQELTARPHRAPAPLARKDITVQNSQLLPKFVHKVALVLPMQMCAQHVQREVSASKEPLSQVDVHKEATAQKV